MIERLVLLLLCLLLLLGVGCDLLERGIAAVDPAPATITPTAEQPAAVVDPPSSTATPETTAVPGRTLTVWLPPEIGGRTQGATAILTEQIRAFNSGHPDLQIVVEQKNVSGPGGMLSYLRTGRNVAPAILPDLIALPGDRLLSATNEELIYPLGNSLDNEMFEALYPAAQTFARPQQMVLGYPFALTNLPHLAYDTAVITATFPLTFPLMLELPEGSLLFPGSGAEGVMIWLQLYLAYGGRLVNEEGQPGLQVEPLTLALEQLRRARQDGFIPLQSSNVANLVDTWQLFEAGGATIVQTSAGQFLRQRDPDQQVGVAPIPGVTEPLTPLVESWAWAVSTPDPAQQNLALELIAFLTQPDNLGVWSQAANIVPARADALAQWPAEDSYVQFLTGELARAEANPVASNSQMHSVLRDAVIDVISLSETPQAAAANAAAVFE
jgi:ABC-type glycerol-3-phosphate transport system substrate-binding protein